MPSSTSPDACSAIDIDLISHACNGADCQYICKTTLKTHSGRIVSALGEADNLQAASDSSRANATRLLHTQLTPSNDAVTQSPWDDASKHSQGPQDRSHDKAMFNGGGSKPASPKQVGLVKKIAQEKGQSAEALSYRDFGKDLAQLTGAEINTLIRTLKGSH